MAKSIKQAIRNKTRHVPNAEHTQKVDRGTHSAKEPLETQAQVSSQQAGLEIYDEAELDELMHRDRKKSGGKKDKLSELREPAWRRLQLVSPDVFDALEALKRKFPNFLEVVNSIEAELHLATLSNQPVVAFEPKLLVGPPGIGKTRFCQDLANALAISFTQKSIATMTASFILTGMHECWGDAMPGEISQELNNGVVANPLILLDEIDKSASDKQFPVTKALLSLLEKHTAKQFKDEFYGLHFDASAINWIASANYLNSISEPILSRFTVFEISAPDEKQSREIIKSIYIELISENDWGKHFKNTIPKSMLDKLSEQPPRAVKKQLMSACARASLRRKSQIKLQLSDLPNTTSSKKRPGMGFLSR